MEASVMLGKQINLDRFRQLSFAGDEQGALQEQLRIIRSMGPLDKLRIDQKEVLADLFNTEFSQIVALQREQDILNDSVGGQQSVWSSIVGTSGTALTTMLGMMPSVLSYGAQIGDVLSGFGPHLGKMTDAIKRAGTAMGGFALKALRGAGALLVKAVTGIWSAFAMIPFGLGIPLAIGAVAALYASYRKAKGAGVQARAMGGPVKAMNPYMVGERGPELFIPATGGNVIPNNRLASGTADRVYGDTSGLQGIMSEIRDGILAGNVDRKQGNKDTRRDIQNMGTM